MTTLEILKGARALIATPEAWTQQTLARNDGWQAVQPKDSEATRFCALGAIYREAQDYGERESAIACLGKHLYECSVGYFNDHSPHAQVLALFDAAIAELESA